MNELLHAPITFIILVITCLVSYSSFNNPGLYFKLMFIPVEIDRRNEWYRFVTHGFVHGSWMHLLFNMISLYSIGTSIEYIMKIIYGDVYGSIFYVLIYFLGMILASVPDFFMHRHNSMYRAVGASGAVSAVMFAYVFYLPKAWLAFPPVPTFVYAIIFLVYSQVMSRRGTDNIGHNAHFWGAVWGLVIVVIIDVIMMNALYTQHFLYSITHLFEPEVRPAD